MFHWLNLQQLVNTDFLEQIKSSNYEQKRNSEIKNNSAGVQLLNFQACLNEIAVAFVSNTFRALRFWDSSKDSQSAQRGHVCHLIVGLCLEKFTLKAHVSALREDL